MIMGMILLIVYGFPVEGLSVEDLSCDVIDWWKADSARFPLIAKAAKIV